MPLIKKFTLLRDADTTLLAEWSKRYQCYRVCALSSGTLAQNIWSLIEPVAMNRFKVANAEDFLRLLDEEFAVVEAALPESRDSLRLQPELGKFLHIVMTPPSGISFNWGGLDVYGVVYEDTIDAQRTIIDT